MAQEEGGYKLFVADLPQDITPEELQTVFSTYGEVTNVHLLHPDPRFQNRGALVTYKEMSSAEDAIKVLDGVYRIRADAMNPIKVSWAKGKTSGGAWGKGGGKDGGGGGVPEPNPDGFKLFVGGLPMDIRDDELRTVFSTYGEVTNVHIMPPHRENGRVAAFVYYKSAQSGEDAIGVLNRQYKIRADAELPIQVMWAMSKDKGAGKGGDWNAWGGGAGGGGGDWQAGGGKGGNEKCKTQDGWKLFVGGLPKDCTEEELNVVFSTYGTIRKILLMAPHAVSQRVAAFVFYETDQSAEDAIKVLDGIYKIRVDADAPIIVKWGTDNRTGGKGGGGWGGEKGGWDNWGKGGGKQAL
eukprot:CAMPEP_0176050906 /NCGR_PEP_ID=MMETSP0120_2-20121206/25306_1 /TAXON_ID=160619 /ORGANISM="Kryptoperidinium foliaceum, Strain CCMP 1326" /LENGTH=352 /DNA_ID=CAMNT_0017384345 /DNA_START=113 /DNA_END=1168 /DNA_ORIENTATION=-